ncbi:TPA: hypothetical protein DCQ44_02230 [Candidatus Taylorbacteria bacterium]|nr:hypothetical protein [Candidatus Taylorbacteria bacterium]
MSKKTLIAVIIIVAVLVLVLGIFLLFFTSPVIQTTNTGLSPNSPFGNYGGSSSTTPITPTPTPDNGQANGPVTPYLNSPTSPLVKISTEPIAGAQVFDRKISGTTTASIVRYMERATGHVLEYNRTNNFLTTASNTTIPSIYQAWWSGNTVLAQFIGASKDTIRTFVGNLPSAPTSTTQLTGTFLNDNVSSLAISPKGNRMFTLGGGNFAIGNISSLDGTKPTSVLNFPFNEWAVEWPNETTLTLTTKPSAGIPGFMYFLTTTGFMTKVTGNIFGLSSRSSPDLGHAVLSASTNGGIATVIYDINKNTSLAFTDNPTLAEKCVWSKLSKTTAYCAIPQNIPIGNYPDDWYQGNVSFVDNIYKIDLTLPAVQLLYKLPSDQQIDVTNLFLDAKEENLYFTNKSDYYLWGLTIKNLTPTGQ